MFQSHNGAIAASLSPSEPYPSGLFQSHNGAIAAWGCLNMLTTPMQFQSHNGAIAAEKKGISLLGLLMVSIPQWCDCCLLDGHNIRAKYVSVSIPQWCDCCRSRTNQGLPDRKRFQSHNGAIAAVQPPAAELPEPSFNPTMVRLLQ